MAKNNDLERQAVDELLQEACRGRERAQTMGPAGWKKCPIRSTNKRFLLNTLRTATLQAQHAASPGTDQSGSRVWEAKPAAQPRRSRQAWNSEPRGHAPSAQRSGGRSRSPVKRSDSGSGSSSSTPKLTTAVQAAHAGHLHPEWQTDGHKDQHK